MENNVKNENLVRIFDTTLRDGETVSRKHNEHPGKIAGGKAAGDAGC